MRKLACLAAVAAVLSAPAFAADQVVSTVISVDRALSSLVLADRSVMIAGKDVDLTAIQPGMKVRVVAVLDEDGYAPATEVAPAQ